MHMETEQSDFKGRTRARSEAVKILFEADQKKVVNNAVLLLALLEERKHTRTDQSPLPHYAVQIVEGFSSSQRDVDALLAKHIKGTTLDRIPSVDRAVLRVAAWEILFNRDDVPTISAIDEAIKVAKPVATDDSPAFINAVLDAARVSIEDPWSRQPALPVEEPGDKPGELQEDSHPGQVDVDMLDAGEDDLDLLLDQY